MSLDEEKIYSKKEIHEYAKKLIDDNDELDKNLIRRINTYSGVSEDKIDNIIDKIVEWDTDSYQESKSKNFSDIDEFTENEFHIVIGTIISSSKF
jgi:Glu-tRNA(Gln) amidotransferase subunit E-like FAD-binding protein